MLDGGVCNDALTDGNKKCKKQIKSVLKYKILVYSFSMSCPLHIEYQGAIYHVTSQCNALQSIFKDNAMRSRSVNRGSALNLILV